MPTLVGFGQLVKRTTNITGGRPIATVLSREPPHPGISLAIIKGRPRRYGRTEKSSRALTLQIPAHCGQPIFVRQIICSLTIPYDVQSR